MGERGILAVVSTEQIHAFDGLAIRIQFCCDVTRAKEVAQNIPFADLYEYLIGYLQLRQSWLQKAKQEAKP